MMPEKNNSADLSKLYQKAEIQAESYNGSETAFQEITHNLIKIEEKLANMLHSSKKYISPNEEKILLTQVKKTTLNVRSISDFLSLAAESFHNRLNSVAEENIEKSLKALGIFVVPFTSSTAFLPPNKKIRPQEGEGIWQKQEIQNRISPLISFLHDHEIFTDDIIVLKGLILPGQMRKLPYHLIDIPKLKKHILVCDVIGEATFVSQEPFAYEYYTTMNKEELITKHPYSISRIIFRSEEQWKVDIAKMLFSKEEKQHEEHQKKSKEEKPIQITKKITAKEVYELKEYIRKEIECETFINMSNALAKKLKLSNNSGIFVIWRKLMGNINSDSYLKKYRLQMALIIWPENAETIRKQVLYYQEKTEANEISNESLIEAIRLDNTYESFINMDNSESTIFRACKLSLIQISTKLIGRNNHSYGKESLLKLSLLIWPEHAKITKEKLVLIQQAKETKEISSEALIRYIRDNNNFAEFTTMNYAEMTSYSLDGLSLRHIWTKLMKTKNTNPQSKQSLLQMALLIWPEKKENIENQLGELEKSLSKTKLKRTYVDTISKESLIQNIRTQTSYKEFASMNTTSALKFINGEITIRMIWTKLMGKKNNNAENKESLLKMALIIWPEHLEDIYRQLNTLELEKKEKEISANLLIEMIRTQITYEDFISMSLSTALKFATGNLTINEIWTKLTGKSHKSALRTKSFLKLALLIWPEHLEKTKKQLDELERNLTKQQQKKEFVSELSKESIIEDIRTLTTYEEFTSMTQKSALNFSVKDLSIHQIWTKIMGTFTYHVQSKHNFLQMALIIWPEHADATTQLLKEIIQKREAKEISKETLIQHINTEYTYEEFINMNQSDMINFSVAKLSLKQVWTKLIGKSAGYYPSKQCLWQLSRIIWPEHQEQIKKFL